MPDERDLVRLRHMHDAASKAIKFCEGLSREDLDKQEILSLALVHLLEIVGEAAKGTSEKTKARAAGIPWKAIAGTRDRLAHRYFEVDLDIVWEIIRSDLPPVIAALKMILDEAAKEDSGTK